MIPLDKHIWSQCATYEQVSTCILLDVSGYMQKRPSGSHLGSAEEIRQRNVLTQALYGVLKRFKACNSYLLVCLTMCIGYRPIKDRWKLRGRILPLIEKNQNAGPPFFTFQQRIDLGHDIETKHSNGVIWAQLKGLYQYLDHFGPEHNFRTASK